MAYLRADPVKGQAAMRENKSLVFFRELTGPGPLGDVLAGPLEHDTGLVTAEIDTGEIVRARYDFDAVGHYARPDIFRLQVDDTPRPGVAFGAFSPE